MNISDDIVFIKKDRLKELEELESRIPILVEEAIKEYKLNALKRLHEKDKTNPKAVADRAKRYLEKNRDAINERRRQKRKLQKASQEIPVDEPKPVTTKIYDYTLQSAKTLSFE